MSDKTICVIGLGYVGLPLAVAFGKKRPVIGFDVNDHRIGELRSHYDRTNEVEKDDFQKAEHLSFTSNPEEIKSAQIYIVTVPTPVDKHNTPDLSPMGKASGVIGKVLNRGDIVIYESTVFPGCTEEFCVPILEKESGLKFNSGFFCGYSPERINPGDKEHTIDKIKKVTSGSTKEIAEEIDNLYREIITAGTHLAPSIKVAEAAKVIENAQRDINIAFVNELALIFARMNINTHDVLAAAKTKWNFLPFSPGLVGGHCIGVDPYYLTYKAESLGYHPQVILSGRKINDEMGKHIATLLIKALTNRKVSLVSAKVLILGITFKENCPDIRNSKVTDIIKELNGFGLTPKIYDPHADSNEVKKEYNVDLLDEYPGAWDGIVLAVAHDEFKGLDLVSSLSANGVIIDVKGIMPPSNHIVSL